MRPSQKLSQGALKPKPLTSQSLKRPLNTKTKENEQKDEAYEMDDGEIQARNVVAQKIDKSIEFRNDQSWDGCFQNLFEAFKINEKFINDAQLDQNMKFYTKGSDILSQIGFAHWNRGDLDQAIEFYENALKMQIKYAKKDHPDIAVTYTNIGTIHLDRKNFAKAIQYFEKAVKIQEQQLNSNHPDYQNQFCFQVISTYSNFGSALFGKDDYLKALEYFRKSQKIEEKIYGMEHIYCKIFIFIMILSVFFKLTYQNYKVTGSLKNIAVIYQTMGEYTKALPVLERELKIKQKNLDKNHLEIGYNLVDISIIKEMKEDYQGALVACEDGLEILKYNLSSSDQKLKQCQERCQVLKNIVSQSSAARIEEEDEESQQMQSQQSKKQQQPFK